MNASITSAVAAALILIGAGCAPAAKIQELPTVPPAAGVMEKLADDATMKEEDGAMMQKEEGETTTEKKEEGAVMKKDAGADVMEKPAAQASALQPYYIAYTDGGGATALSEGRATLLYFFAAWCPICRAEDPNIKSWIESSGLPVAGFRVDYDKESALKAKYKIPYQHTTVILNTKGDEVRRFSGPMTQTELVDALSAASK